MSSRSGPNRRCFVLITVLVIVASALLVGTGLIFAVQTQSLSSAVTAETAQARALAWSGVQAVSVELNGQRDVILEGRLPTLEPQYTIYETPTGLGIVRLIAVNAGPGQERLIAESARLDLNSVEPAALANAGLIEQAAAEAIQSHRNRTGRPLQSVSELLSIEGANITTEMMFGPLDEIRVMDDAEMAQVGLDERVAGRLQAPMLSGIADALTVFAVEPALQQDGKRRINLNAEWTQQLAGQIEQRFGAETAKLLEEMFKAGARFNTDSRIYQKLRELRVPPEEWPPIIDAFTTEKDEHHFGRLNINAAPYEALLALPGMTPEQATQIVSVREELSAAERGTIAWPAIAQIIPPEAYDQLGDKMTTRSWTFRVRLSAGEVPADQPDAILSNHVMYEAVIDLSSPEPRIAYLRDITQLQNTVRIAASSAASAQELEPGQAEFALDPSQPDNESATQPASRTDEAGREPSDPNQKTTANGEPADSAATQPQSDSNATQTGTSGLNSSKSRKKVGRWVVGH